MSKAAMTKSRKSWILSNIVSPYGLAAFSYGVFLLSCLIPPSTYRFYMDEPDLMFLDSATIVFYTLCVMFFLAGVWIIGWIGSATLIVQKLETRISPIAFLLAPILLGLAVTLLSIVLLLGHNPTIVLLLLAQQGADVKHTIAFDTGGNFSLAPLISIGVIWWAYWRASQFSLSKYERIVVNTALSLAVLSVLISSTLILSRDRLMLVVSGLAILKILHKTAKGQVTYRFVFRSCTLIAVSISLLFFSFSYLRGSDSWNDQVYLLFGYTVASYNRLAAIVHGLLRSPMIDRGVYLSGFFAFNRFIPLNEIMGWRNHDDIFDAAFGAVSGVGLDGHLVWSGAFGDMFLDIGWYSCILVFGYGLLYGIVWNWFKRGKALGVVLYPCLGFCTLFWFGSNYLLDSQPIFLAVTAILIAGYEFLLIRSSSV